MIENTSYDRGLADQEDRTKLPKFQLHQINRGDFIGIYVSIYCILDDDKNPFL